MHREKDRARKRGTVCVFAMENVSNAIEDVHMHTLKCASYSWQMCGFIIYLFFSFLYNKMFLLFFRFRLNIQSDGEHIDW